MDPLPLVEPVKSEYDDSFQDVPDLVYLRNIKQEPTQNVADFIYLKNIKQEMTPTISENTMIKEECSTISGQCLPEHVESPIKIERDETIPESEQMYQVKVEDLATELVVKERDSDSDDNSVSPNYSKPDPTAFRNQNGQEDTSIGKLGTQETLYNIEPVQDKLKCDQCGCETSYMSNLNNHTNTFRINTMYKCEKCNYSTIKEHDSKMNLAIPENSESHMYKCNQCPYKTTLKLSLKWHILRHKKQKDFENFKCDHCNFQTVYKDSMKAHLLRHRRPKKHKDFRCDQCEYETKQYRSFALHLLQHKIPDDVGEFKCNRCSFQTSRQSYLKQHLVRHKKPDYCKMLKCDQCYYQTIRRDHLIIHVTRKHKETQDMFKCHHCEYQANSRDVLKIHLLKHRKSKEVEHV